MACSFYVTPYTRGHVGQQGFQQFPRVAGHHAHTAAFLNVIGHFPGGLFSRHQKWKLVHVIHDFGFYKAWENFGEIDFVFFQFDRCSIQVH